MRTRHCIMLSIIVVIGLVPLIAQDDEDPHTGFSPSMRMESREGNPGHSDVISRRHVSADNHARCIQVEDHGGPASGGGACLLKYDTGEKLQLNFGKSTRFPKDGEVYLECLGTKPTYCVVGLW